jgi:hypothetical protein
LEEYSRKEAAEARRLQVEQMGLLDQLAQKNALIAALRQQAANSRQPAVRGRILCWRGGNASE